jgi:hypothetical protein
MARDRLSRLIISTNRRQRISSDPAPARKRNRLRGNTSLAYDCVVPCPLEQCQRRLSQLGDRKRADPTFRDTLSPVPENGFVRIASRFRGCREVGRAECFEYCVRLKPNIFGQDFGAPDPRPTPRCSRFDQAFSHPRAIISAGVSVVSLGGAKGRTRVGPASFRSIMTPLRVAS